MVPDSRTLRRLAESVLEPTDGEALFSEEQREELITSLVRQWLTYDGHATLVSDDSQVFFHLSQTPLGAPRVERELLTAHWAYSLCEEWQIDSELLPDLLEQLNRGQSAEAVNRQGEPLRLWVNPRDRSKGVEATVRPGALSAGALFSKIAASALRQHFGDLGAAELKALTESVLRQWKRFQGTAALFIGTRKVVILTITKVNGAWQVKSEVGPVDLHPVLRKLGFSEKDIPAAITQFNLGLELQMENRDGNRCRIWYDPKNRRMERRRLSGQDQAVSAIFCPTCGSVMDIGLGEVRPQCCLRCALQDISGPVDPPIAEP